MKVIPKSGCLTLEEIKQQPRVWNSILIDILNDETKYKQFLTPLLKIENLEIILTGTGASAYVGDTLKPYIEKKSNRKVRSIPTTDIISNPYNFLDKTTPTLVITYSRSGNTAETNYCYDILNNFSDNIYHLIVTCNKDGTLSKISKNNPKALIVSLPSEANDKALAMTSAYTSMIFSNILIANIDNLGFITKNLHLVLSYSKKLLASSWNDIYNIVSKNPTRIIFLGTDELKGLSNYCALNILKLTNKKIYSLSLDPKLLKDNIFPYIDNKTLVILFHSNKKENFIYEKNFLLGLKQINPNCNISIISESPLDLPSNSKNFILSNNANIPDCFSSICFSFLGQILAYLYSLHLKISVDNP